MLGVGFGILVGAGAMFADARLASVQLGMSVVAILFMAAGTGLGIYNSVSYRKEVKRPTIETELQPGEQIVRVFPGGHRITRYSDFTGERRTIERSVDFALGKWCITDQRLIFEGSKPGGLRPESDTVSVPIKDIVNLEIVKAGALGKFLEATLTSSEKVQITGRKLEEFRDILQQSTNKYTKN
jgi:hypothetical protein